VRAPAETANLFSLEALSRAVEAAGLEVYRAEAAELRIAQRIRMHLMDSGVTVLLDPSPRVCVTIRAQRSDFPADPADALIARVREAVVPKTSERGYAEVGAQSREIQNPTDVSDVLDVWHELTFAKPFDDVGALIDEVRWALAMPKCIEP
jgi:hypothetical protein